MAGCCRGGQLHGRQPAGGCHCVCACACSGFPAGSHPPIPNTAPSMANDDPLLLALVTRLLQSSSLPPPPPPSYQIFAEEFHGFHCPPQQWGRQKRDLQHQCQQHLYERLEQPEQQAQSLIRSLLRRIASLEKAMSSSPPPVVDAKSPLSIPKVSARGQPPPRRALLRDLAARTIQSAFRQYLVRRSRTLRDLKLLASIRSHLPALRSFLLDESRINPKVLYQKVADLLRQLDSIQSSDAMIREGKRPIGRDLRQLLAFAESLMEQKPEAGIETMEPSRRNVDQRTFSGNGRAGAEDIPDLLDSPLEEAEESDEGSPNVRVFSTSAAKGTAFDQDAKGSRNSTIACESIMEEEKSRIGPDGRVRRVDSLFARTISDETIGRKNGGFGDESLRSKQKGVKFFNGRSALTTDQDGSSSPGLSAPLPLQMEPRKGNANKPTVAIR